MGRRHARVVGAASALALLWAGAAGAQAATQTTHFTSPGEHIFRVPPGVHDVTIIAIGAAGGACHQPGGLGAALTAKAPVTPLEPLFVGVGGQGAACNDGGAGGSGGGAAGGSADSPVIGPGGGGGGASVVATLSPLPSFPAALVVAGAGGGAGGHPGGNAGSPGKAGTAAAEGGGAGTLTAGGSGGVVVGRQHSGQNGSAGIGGTGAPFSACEGGGGPAGGGGGAGYYGGGGGATCDRHEGSGGGGGGSSFVAPRVTTLLAPAPANAPASISFTYAAPRVQESEHSIGFGPETVGSLSKARELTVANEGSAPLVISRVSLGGTNPNDFLIGDHCQRDVPEGDSCRIAVRFAPQEKGARSATLQLTTNATNDADEVRLTGGDDISQTRAGRLSAASADRNGGHDRR